MDATSTEGTAYLSRSPQFIPFFSGVCVAGSLVFYVVFCRSLFVFFLLVIVLSVLLQITVFDYPIWYFKTCLITIKMALYSLHLCIIRTFLAPKISWDKT